MSTRSDEPPDEVMRAALQEIDAALHEELLSRLRTMSAGTFERLVVRLLEKMGFGRGLQSPGRAIGGPGDGGIDGVIDQDGLGLDRIYIQAKRYAAENTVGSGAINEFFGSLDDVKAAKGVFITSSRFTKAAEATAAKKSKRIDEDAVAEES
jgi:restriction system protein